VVKAMEIGAWWNGQPNGDRWPRYFRVLFADQRLRDIEDGQDDNLRVGWYWNLHAGEVAVYADTLESACLAALQAMGGE
jgi:hypothetical protein